MAVAGRRWQCSAGQAQRNPVTECIGVVEVTCSRALPECFRKYLGTALQKLDNLVGLYIYIFYMFTYNINIEKIYLGLQTNEAWESLFIYYMCV